MPNSLKVGSLFTGIGGFDLGFELAGFETVWQVEQEPFCIAVLKTRFPNAERYYEIKDCGGVDHARRHKLKPVDVITAGVPCQDVSVAGRRAGLAGERTGLFYEFARILKEVRPAWFVFENVPGLLSSNRGRDFAEILRVLMVECGYGVCWRVLDSQFFGVAQRRRRVFLAGRFGKPCPAEVLFEPEGSEGNLAQGREAGQGIAHAVGGSSVSSGYRYDPNGEDYVVASLGGSGHRGGFMPNAEQAAGGHLIAGTISASYGEGVGLADERSLIPGTYQNTGHGWWNESGTAQSIRTPGGGGSLEANLIATLNSGGNTGGFRTEPGEHLITGTIGGGGRGVDEAAASGQYVCSPVDPHGMRDFTGLPLGLDSARYRSLGNACTVQVCYWIAERIKAQSEQERAAGAR